MLGRGFAKTFLRRSGLSGLAWQRRKRVIGLRSHFGCEIAAAGRARPAELEGSVFLAESRDVERGCKAGILDLAVQEGFSGAVRDTLDERAARHPRPRGGGPAGLALGTLGI